MFSPCKISKKSVYEIFSNKYNNRIYFIEEETNEYPNDILNIKILLSFVNKEIIKTITEKLLIY